MTSINLDNLSENIRHQLEQRAKFHGCSIESELDSILQSVFEQTTSENSLKELLLAMPDLGEDADFDRVKNKSKEISL